MCASCALHLLLRAVTFALQFPGCSGVAGKRSNASYSLNLESLLILCNSMHQYYWAESPLTTSYTGFWLGLIFIYISWKLDLQLLTLLTGHSLCSQQIWSLWCRSHPTFGPCWWCPCQLSTASKCTIMRRGWETEWTTGYLWFLKKNKTVAEIENELMDRIRLMCNTRLNLFSLEELFWPEFIVCIRSNVLICD